MLNDRVFQLRAEILRAFVAEMDPSQAAKSSVSQGSKAAKESDEGMGTYGDAPGVPCRLSPLVIDPEVLTRCGGLVW